MTIPAVGSRWATSEGDWVVVVEEVNKRGRGYNLTVSYGPDGPRQFFRLKDFLRQDFILVTNEEVADAGAN